MQNNNITLNGGKVLSITSIGSNFFKIRKRIISNIKRINWKKVFTVVILVGK